MVKILIVGVLVVFASLFVRSDVYAADPDVLPISYENVVVSMTPDESSPSSEITIQGSNFPKEGPHSEGPITYWYGYLNTKCLQIGHFEAGISGSFSRTVSIPKDAEEGSTNYVYLNKYCVKITSEYIKFTHSIPTITVESVGDTPVTETISIEVFEPTPKDTDKISTPSPISDVAITEITGKKGQRGPRGDRGPEGPRGDRGPEGMQGPDGDVGIVGEMGIQGVIGEPGPQGEIGPRGPTGDSGQASLFTLLPILVAIGALVIALVRYYRITTD